MCGKRLRVTAIGYGSTSAAHTGSIPHRLPASGNPPEPSNKLPSFTACPPPAAPIASITQPPHKFSIQFFLVHSVRLPRDTLLFLAIFAASLALAHTFYGNVDFAFDLTC